MGHARREKGASQAPPKQTTFAGSITIEEFLQVFEELLAARQKQKPSSPGRFLPDFPVLARACLWRLVARMWRANLPVRRDLCMHTRSEGAFNTAHCACILAQASKGVEEAKLSDAQREECVRFFHKADARPSLIPSLCTRFTRAGNEWRRGQHTVSMARPYKEPHHSGQVEP